MQNTLPASVIFRNGRFFDPKTELSSKTARPSPDWIKDTVIYEVNMRAFSPMGKFQDLEARLAELKNLGVNCIWLMPLHPIGEVKRKGKAGSPYSVKDYAAIDIAYGTKDGFRSMIQQAHFLGMKVIVDWVLNHSAWDNPLIKAHPEWYKKNEKGEIVPPNEHWEDVAAFDYSSPALRKYMIDMLSVWVKEYDIDGFRFDVADLVPLDFWEEARAKLEKEKAYIFFLAEGDKSENHLAAFDMTYSWDVYDTLVDLANGKVDLKTLEDQLALEEKQYPLNSLHLRFIENHDKERAAKLLGHANDAGAVFMYTVGGVPMLYNGQEIGETRAISLFEREIIDWENRKFQNAKALSKLYKKLANLRTEHPSLRRGQRFRVRTDNDSRVFAFARSYRGDAVLVVINFSAQEFKGAVQVPQIFWSEKGKLLLKPALDGPAIQVQGQTAAITLPAWGFQVFELK